MIKSGITKNTVEICLFLGILFAIFAVSSYFVKPGSGEVYNIVQVTQRLDSFEKEPTDTIDVVFAGNSEVYRSFSPLQIFADTGITSFLMSDSALRLCDAAELIRASFRSQTPMVIVLEADLFLYF